MHLSSRLSEKKDGRVTAQEGIQEGRRDHQQDGNKVRKDVETIKRVEIRSGTGQGDVDYQHDGIKKDVEVNNMMDIRSGRTSRPST